MTFEELVDPAFDALLRESNVQGYAQGVLRDNGDLTLGLWPDLAIAYVNPAWFRFAERNGAGPEFFEQWTLGRSMLDAVPDALRPHYIAAYEQCLQTGEPWSEDYECSSPDEFRMLRSTAYPLLHGAGLLVVHSLRIERPHDRTAVKPSRGRFADQHGWLTQCAYCNRFAEAQRRRRWAWVPDWVREPPEPVTHGICEPCAGYYFGVLRERRRIGA